MSFSPGKIGELIKSLLIKKKFSLGYSETIPVVVAERIIEFFTLLIICSAGLIILKFEIAYIIGSTAISVIIFFTVQNKTLLQKIIKIISGCSPIKIRIDSYVTFELTFS
jgi:hypothetical protein